MERTNELPINMYILKSKKYYILAMVMSNPATADISPDTPKSGDFLPLHPGSVDRMYSQGLKYLLDEYNKMKYTSYLT